MGIQEQIKHELKPVILVPLFFKLAYIGIRPQEATGSDNDTFTIGCSLQW